ncbi:MAG: hypothetical protein R3F13_13235 [Prosthecobacter sp.]
MSTPTAPAPAAPAAEPLNDMDATIAALDAAMASEQPLQAGAGIDGEPFQAQLPDPEPAPTQAAEPAPVAPAPAAPANTGEDDEPPAPVVHPSAKPALPEGMPRNFRLAAQDEAEALAFLIRKSNPNMHMRDALVQAEKQLGLSPAAPAAGTAPASPPAPTPPTDPVAEIDTQIAALETQLGELNPALDAEEYRRVNLEINKLGRQQAALIAKQEALEQIEQRDAIAQELTAAEAQFAEVADKFEDLKDESSEFSQAFAALHNRNVQTNSPCSKIPTTNATSPPRWPARSSCKARLSK